MNGRAQLLLVLALSSGCSLRSLAYLQKGDSAEGGAGASVMASSGSAGMPSTPAAAGASPVAAASGAAGSTVTANCEDGSQNGDEADVDCGGRSCSPCAAGKRCVGGSDCSSAICTNQVCQPPSCGDLARNGDETDLNCGGSCTPCATGYACLVGSDCQTGQCASAVCTVPNCDGASPDAACPLLAPNTAYSLRPAHAKTSCIDAVGLGVESGVEMQQYACNDNINQTFWALAAEAGYFSLRNALSGKCLQVRANSLESGALIEQASCSGQGNQLFLPSADSAGLKLVVQSSGLSLDVAGAASTSDGQRIVQSSDDGSLDMRWSAMKTSSAGLLTLNALGQSGVLLHHVATVVRTEAALGLDAQWKVEPGLASAACVSFESADQPGAYLRHANSLLWSDISDGSANFSQDATFCFRPALSGSSYAVRALESFNYPGNYVSASDGRVRLLTFQDSASFRQLASWAVGPYE